MSKIINGLVRLLYPNESCPICEEDALGICLSCTGKLRILNEESRMENQRGISLLEYNEQGKLLLAAFKKKGSFYAGDAMVDILIAEKRDFIRQFDGISYAPSSRKTIQFLGFDPGKYLAEQVSGHMKIPYYNLFPPTKNIQKHFDTASRVENASQIAFRRGNFPKIQKKRILLLDDVYISGSTVRRCLSLLENRDMKGMYLTFFRE